MLNENIIWSREEEIELERFCDFMARMIEKYANEIVFDDEIGVGKSPAPKVA